MVEYRAFESYFENAVSCGVIDEVFDKIEAEEFKGGPLGFERLQRIRQGQDWSYLNSRIVG